MDIVVEKHCNLWGSLGGCEADARIAYIEVGVIGPDEYVAKDETVAPVERGIGPGDAHHAHLLLAVVELEDVVLAFKVVAVVTELESQHG